MVGSKMQTPSSATLREKFFLAFTEEDNGLKNCEKKNDLYRSIVKMDRLRPDPLLPILYKIWGLKALPKVTKSLRSIVGFAYLIHKVLNKPGAQKPIMKALEEREARYTRFTVSNVLELDQVILRSVIEIALSNSILLAGITPVTLRKYISELKEKKMN